MQIWLFIYLFKIGYGYGWGIRDNIPLFVGGIKPNSVCVPLGTEMVGMISSQLPFTLFRCLKALVWLIYFIGASST
jgi:hypothetical protein